MILDSKIPEGPLKRVRLFASLVLNRVLLGTIGILLVFSNSSCGVYHPQLAAIPLIDHKGDVRLSTMISTPSSASLTINAGVTDHIAVQMYTDITPMVSTNYSHLAIGYYGKWEKSAFELYAGFGCGTSKVTDVDHTWLNTGKYYIPYAQANWGLTNLTKAHVDFGVSLKAGYIIPEFHIINTERDVYSWDTETGYLIEPQLFARFGSEYIKFGLQAGYCLTNIFQTEETYYDPFAVGLGVTFFVKPK